MKYDTSGALPLLIVLLLIGTLVLFVFGALVCLAFKQIIALVLVGAGIYFLVRPIAGASATMRVLVPLALIAVGALIVLGYLWT